MRRRPPATGWWSALARGAVNRSRTAAVAGLRATAVLRTVAWSARCAPRGDHPVHLFGRGHPVLDQHRQRQPVTPADVHLHRPHGFARFLSGTAPLWRRAYRTGQQLAPTTGPTTKARPRSRCDNASVDQAGIPADNPADNRPHPLAHPPANPQVTMPARAWSGWPTSPLRPRVPPHSRKNTRSGWVGQAPGGGRGDRAPPVLLARDGGAVRDAGQSKPPGTRAQAARPGGPCWLR